MPPPLVQSVPREDHLSPQARADPAPASAGLLGAHSHRAHRRQGGASLQPWIGFARLVGASLLAGSRPALSAETLAGFWSIALLAAFSLAGLAAGIGWSAWAVANGGLSPGQFAAMMVALQEVRTHVDSGLLSRRLSRQLPPVHRRSLHLPRLGTGRAKGWREPIDRRRRGPDCSQQSLLPLSTGGTPSNRRHFIHHPARRARGPRRCQRLGQNHASQSAVGLVPPHAKGRCSTAMSI